MNKKILLTIISISFFFIFSTTTYAINQNQSVAIQNLLDEACKKSNTPGISVAIVSDKEASFFSSGYSNLDKKFLLMNRLSLSLLLLVKLSLL